MIDILIILYYNYKIDQVEVKMKTVILSSKFQVCIPKEMRKELGLKAGQKLVVIQKGHGLYMVPLKSLDALKGIFSGSNSNNYRDHSDRI